jgi:hypothetical protein
MFALTFIGDIVVFAAGGAVVWFFKDPILKWYKGAEKFAQDLKAKADKIKGAL